MRKETSRAEVAAPPCNPYGMRVPWLCGAFATALVLYGGTGAALGDTGQSARVQAAYDTQCADIVRGNFDDFSKTLSPVYMAHVQEQTLSRDDVLAQMKRIAGTVTFDKCTTTVDSATVSAGVIVAVARRVLDGSQSGTPFEVASGSRDMWTPNGNALQETSSTSIWSTISVNGQIVQQSGIVPTPTPTSTPTPPPLECGIPPTPTPSATP